MHRICVFCGSSSGDNPAYIEQAWQVGQALAQAGITLVYGGASIGVMNAVADAVLAQSGQVIGVIPKALTEHEIVHAGLTELHVVGSMHERKALMAELSDAFMALPGGLGTMEEFFEAWTWAQLGIHRKPLGLLNVAGYFDPLLVLIDHMIDHGFVRPHNRSMVLVETEVIQLLQGFAAYESPVKYRGDKLLS